MTTETPVSYYLRGIESWEQSSGSARIAFCFDMRGRVYGPNETRVAWDWFFAGYRAHETQLNLLAASNAGQIETLRKVIGNLMHELGRYSQQKHYIHAIGDAGERYLTSQGVRMILPATFRWEDLWIAMCDARRRT